MAVGLSREWEPSPRGLGCGLLKVFPASEPGLQMYFSSRSVLVPVLEAGASAALRKPPALFRDRWTATALELERPIASHAELPYASQPPARRHTEPPHRDVVLKLKLA